MPARIYQPAKTAMSSGMARTGSWVLEFVPDTKRGIDPLMGWTSSTDTQAQVQLRFDTKEAALDYARANGIDAIVTQPQRRSPNVRPGGYGENFATNRRGAWTH
ncbi:NADH-ubiquinone oxidoreductase 18 kDa subunit [Oceaniovalibus guishaninsula JLT2003]|uniref:NADH-ubiquinone oxidoreductase 18 kDa subunit n=1 Tax=Oceaniovalibus guishaninsula JLT2003 TaxID=1231392 RepID=K2GRR1_9RHOB|nr:ETC complex I subunit [Oceaniovalibus guishaninsula]EKE45321.1 NADH-ubiquinone oxidoreductase 18 kDa subunit [Oceaniovalibus guishaninsula JLT2003]